MTIDQSGEVIQKDDYYPFGLTFNSWTDVIPENQYKYYGKEEQQEWGVIDYGARMYQADLGRWFNVDPLAESFYDVSTYNYGLNNPVRFIDPDGRFSTDVIENDDGTYSVVGGDPNDGDNGIYVMVENENGDLIRDDNKSIGETLTSHSFFDDNEQPVYGAVIDFTSTEGQDFIDKEIIEADPSLAEYIIEARAEQDLDLKERNIEERAEGTTKMQHRYRGSITADGRIGSARDFGNVAAGIVAGRKGLSWFGARVGFDSYNMIQHENLVTEPATTKKAQKLGHDIGVELRKSDKKD